MFGLAASSFLLSYSSYNDMRQSDIEIRRHPAYSEATKLANVIRDVKLARSKFVYKQSITSCVSEPWGGGGCVTQPPSYPKPEDARTLIDKAITQLGDLRDIDDQLTDIRDSLPNQNDIKEYNGRRVDNFTFRAKRDSLSDVISDISVIRDSYMQEIPSSLRYKKSGSKYFFIASLLTGIGNLSFGLNTLLRRNLKQGESR